MLVQKKNRTLSLISAIVVFMLMGIVTTANSSTSPFAQFDSESVASVKGDHKKCGEGKCGDKAEKKCGEGKCGDKAEKKCGEGKCGDKKSEKKCG